MRLKDRAKIWPTSEKTATPTDRIGGTNSILHTKQPGKGKEKRNPHCWSRRHENGTCECPSLRTSEKGRN